MRGWFRSRSRAALGVGGIATIAALAVVVFPAIGSVGDPIPPPSIPGGVTPTEVDTGGQSNDCALFNTTSLTLNQFRIDTPKTQSYSSQVAGRTATFALTVVSTGKDKDKFFEFAAQGALVYYVGVKGGTKTAKYDYSAAPRSGDGNLHASLDNQGKLYSVSNTTFCFTTAASISGAVFADADGDGTRDSGESGISGATVALFDGATPAGTAVTNSSGSYTFANVAIGKTYTVCQPTLGATWTRTLPVVGPPATPATADCPDGTRGYLVPLSTSVSNLDFGNVQTATVSGRVFEDANSNRAADTDEGGITSQTVTLRRNGTFVATATLETSGAFTITGVPVGSGYTLCVTGTTSLKQTVPVSPDGVACSTTEGTRGTTFTLTGAGSTGNLFGFRRQAEVAGVIFDDKDLDGTKDDGEGGVSGREVYLYKAGTLLDPVSTGDGGAFSFGMQDVGTAYKVCVASATGQAQTYPTSGTTGSAACGATGETEVGWGFTLATGGEKNLGFGSVAAITGSCADPFGSEEGYVIQLAGGPPDPCDKAFVYAYDDTDSETGGLASLTPVPGATDPKNYAMVERITWKLPSGWQQFDIHYDDIPPYLPGEPAAMLYCKLDPRAAGEEFDLDPAYFSSDFEGDPAPVIPNYPTQTSCIITEQTTTAVGAVPGKYVAYIYSSIDGLRLPNG